MGVYGRDWMREGGVSSTNGGTSMTVRLVIANAIAWFVYAGSLRFGGRFGGLYGFITDELTLHTDAVFAHGRIWQPLTAIFLHDPSRLDHVFFNLLFLWIFGRIVEGMISSRALLALYLAGGAVSALALVPVAAFEGHPVVGLGASGAVYAIGVFRPSACRSSR